MCVFMESETWQWQQQTVYMLYYLETRPFYKTDTLECMASDRLTSFYLPVDPGSFELPHQRFIG